MNKSELVREISKTANVTQKDTEKMLNAFTVSVMQALSKGDKVQLIGFGTFEVKKRKARTGRNPRKPDELIKIPEMLAPTFKAGKQFKDAANGK